VKKSIVSLCLVTGFLYTLGCATVPESPKASGPYAVLKFPPSMQLIAVDQQAAESRRHVSTLRLTPGKHSLRFMHINAGIDGSAEHDGELAYPFTLDVQEGMVYQFESKT
jgi:hypothetical protein